MPNVGIFEEKFGGDEWGFLIAEVGIFTQKILATLMRSVSLDSFPVRCFAIPSKKAVRGVCQTIQLVLDYPMSDFLGSKKSISKSVAGKRMPS